jgi:predicted ATPase
MIQHVEFENYRSIRRASLRLTPMTVLVGPNGAGKSNILRGLANEMGRGASWRGEGDARVRGLGPLGGAVRIHRLEPNHLRQRHGAGHASQLEITGQNLVQVVDSLGRKGMDEYSKALCQLIPLFHDVDVQPQSNVNRLVFFDRWKPDFPLEPEDVSDGTMLVAGFLAIARQLARPALIGIEEPERGLHPWLLEEIVKVLRGIAEDPARPIQVVLATQSPALLNHCRPDEVRFVDRDPADGSTVITEAPTTNATWDDAYTAHRQKMGALWLTGALGGTAVR